ncbi:MAG TPA: 16S rRNA (adenine(1518)-N(6)/adenine(1519)-N(6))-dimethyltransferase RsmA [Bacteroidales bacterium]|nr:16S rRNA (adenine(1518)-N(6)/adenine(1519)-N(6))-dimethyltransferase RsmA [Bacteroidales bacterium]
MVRPKKHLGQHFLHDRNIAGRIAMLVPDDAGLVLEIGPGTGVLTQFLLPRFGSRLRLIEIDGESVAYLKQHFDLAEGQLLHEDFLVHPLESFEAEHLVIAGNFPYNISSQIFFRILASHRMVSEVVCMIQLEVAQRIAAPPGSRTYGILSVLLQAWFDIRLIFEVGPGAFVPPPKVKSAVVHLQRNAVQQLGCDELLFYKVVKQAFNQRRKTLRNALSGLVARELEHPLLEKRAEQLAVDDFVRLTSWIEGINKID